MSHEVDRLVEGLARRVQALEDEAAITKLLVRYGFTVDSDDVEAMLKLFDRKTRITLDGTWEMHGHEEARQIVEGPAHQGYLPYCAHNLGPFVIEVNGDEATASGYSRVYLRSGEEFVVERVSANWWRLERKESGWLIVERETALIGSGDVSLDIVRKGI
jgi:hypothetical protein